MYDVNEHVLDAALEDFRSGTLPRIAAPGALAVQGTVSQRRRNRAVLVAAALTVAVLVPAGIAAARRDQALPALPGGSPQVSASAAPASPPPPSPPTSASSAPSRAPDTPTSLADATLTVASWGSDEHARGCPSGPVNFSGGVSVIDSSSDLRILPPVVAADVNGDGGKEALVTIMCRLGQSGPQQVIAVTGPSGALRTLGRVYEGEDVLSVKGGAGGTVDVKVGDVALCCATPELFQVQQTRTFRWAGSGFDQVGGPTSFTADRSYADLSVRSAQAVLSTTGDGKRTAVVRIQLHNAGPHALQDVSVRLDLDRSAQFDGTVTGAQCQLPASGEVAITVCKVGPVAAGATVSLTLPVRFTDDWGGDLNSARYQVRAGEQKYGDWVQLPYTAA